MSNRLINQIRPEIDLVIIGGDLAEKNVPITRIDQNIRLLSSLGKLYFVWGNNDREVGEQTIRYIIEKYQGTVIENNHIRIPAHPTWGLCGTDDPSCRKLNIEQTLFNIDQYEHVLFVSHQPSVWKKVEQFFQPTMMLAGHTHGGQIRLGKYGIDKLGSFEQIGNRIKLISNGFGTSMLPLRLGAHPESHLITVYYEVKSFKNDK